MKKLMGRFRSKRHSALAISRFKKRVQKPAKKVSKMPRKVKKSPKKLKKMPKTLRKGKKVIKKVTKKVKVLKKKAAPKKLKKILKKPVVQKPAKKTAKPAVKKMQEVSTVKAAVQPQMPTQAQPSPFRHEPVLVQEVLENLQLADKKVVMDGTLGLGGHSMRMLEQMPSDGVLIGFDVDDDNLATARQNLQQFGDRVMFVRSNFSNLEAELKTLNINAVDAILLDLGLSSPQVDNPVKGFSFLREGPLDMRFDKNASLTAAEVINSYGQNELIRIFQVYGEEPFARKIAQEITKRRKARSFKTTTELANFIEKLIGRKGHLHPATRVFQALRIEVNHELDVLLSALKQAVSMLKKHGRLAVIAYHSLEDRVVKQFFKECARDYINEPDKLTTTHLEPTLHIVTKKPIVPTESEISKNPRSRSAKLRVAEKI